MRKQMEPSFWRGKRVFLTGHTGFKGAWLAYWLQDMGAIVTGYSLAPETDPSMFELLGLADLIDSHIGNICDFETLRTAMLGAKPDVVLHLAAQTIVSTGYSDPVNTFSTNVMGVVNVLEVCREIGGDLPVLVVSSDKCYRNDDSGQRFKINDPLGGKDPYSASKAGTEIVVGAYTASYFNDPNGPRIASARAGNVVGGGDWSADRLLPDGARAFSQGLPLLLRNPLATRPWQHVIEPLHGYLMLVEAMVKDRSFARAWNFGPSDRNHVPVGDLANLFAKAWGEAGSIKITTDEQSWVEAKTLDLDCSETYQALAWRPVLNIEATALWTADWYRTVYADPSVDAVRAATRRQINDYVDFYAEDT